MVKVNKALIVGDFNIHVDNTNDSLGLAFTDLIHSFGVKQNVTGNVPSIVFFLAEQNFSLLGRHFSHLSKNILYTRPVQRAQKKCVTLNFNVLLIFDLTLDVTK